MSDTTKAFIVAILVAPLLLLGLIKINDATADKKVNTGKGGTASAAPTKPGTKTTGTTTPKGTAPKGSSTSNSTVVINNTTIVLNSNNAGPGTPGQPWVGSGGNTNPVLSQAQDWVQLQQAAANQQWYKDGEQSFLGLDQGTVECSANLVRQGADLRFILVLNNPASDDQAKAALKAAGYTNVDHLQVVRYGGILNTRGVPQNKLEPFSDYRSQIRMSLAIPKDCGDLSKGIRTDEGVLTQCGNLWKLIPLAPSAPTTTTVTNTTVPRQTTTTVVQTTTTAPATTVPQSTTTAPTTTAPPSTTTTAPPNKPCRDPFHPKPGDDPSWPLCQPPTR